MGASKQSKQPAPTVASPTPTMVPSRTVAAQVSASAIGNRSMAKLFRSARSSAPPPPGLAISSPNDPAELEADRIAAEVMRMPDDAAPAVARSVSSLAVQRKCAACEEDEEFHRSESEAALQRQASDGSAPLSSLSASVTNLLASGGGLPLPTTARAPMETAFGADFASVRVHDDATANQAARDIGAAAFTHRQDIYFASGRFQPEIPEGKKLLAHELTHTLQQSNSTNAPLARSAVGQPGTSRNRETTGGVKREFTRHTIASSVLTSGGAQIQRSPNGEVSSPVEPVQAPEKKADPLAAPVLPMNVDVVTHRDVQLGADKPYLKSVLLNMTAREGALAVVEFVATFRLLVSTKSYHRMPEEQLSEYSKNPRIAEDIAWHRKARSVLKILEEVHQEIQKENQQFLEEFEEKARSVVEEALKESRKHVFAEAVRYGVGDLHLETRWYGGLQIKGDVADNASTRGIAIAAEGLLTRKKKVDEARHEYQRFAGAMSIPSPEAARQRSGLQEHEVDIYLSQLRGEISQAQRDLDVFRLQAQMKFPLLAALSGDEDFKRRELEDLAKGSKGKNSDATAVIVNQILEKLKNISDVQEGLKPGGDVNIWRVPSIVESTMSELGATPDSVHGRIVSEKVKAEKPSPLTGILIGILQLGLVLLAPFTEGLTLIPAAAISAGSAYQHFKEYETKKALRGTDFGAAALSAEDPSLFWLAVDIVGAGFDVTAAGGAAFRLFRELAPAARAVRGAQAGEEAVGTLERNARELGGEALARRVGADARALEQAAGKQVGITAEEARKFEQAATDIAAQELREGVQTAETLAGGKVSVSRSGGIFSCSSPCTMVRERFKNLLVREPKYVKRLNELEGRARSLPHGADGDLARQQIAKEAAALEREMRTTALPGDWTSPLKDASEFDALVKRRGSVAAELDHHPTGWSGKDEARFRYGKELEPEAGYRWTMDENGGLRYDRLDAALPPRRYNPASGLFEEAAEEGLIRATRGAEQTSELAKLPQKEREAMEAAFKNRGDLIAERDRLEALQEAGKIESKDAEKLKKLYAKINEQSRQLGEEAAEGVMKTKGGKKLYPLAKKSSGSGDFDQVWKVGDEFHIVEAKGGSSGLGSRAVGQGVRAEQGTMEYARNIAENMARNGATKEIRQLGNELLAGLGNGKVRYILVRAPIGTQAGASVVRDVQVSEFLIK